MSSSRAHPELREAKQDRLAAPGDWLPRGRVALAVRDPASGELLAEYVLDSQETPDG